MEITETQIDVYPLWLRIAFRLLSATVAATILGLIGSVRSGHSMMLAGIWLGIACGLWQGERAIGGVVEIVLTRPNLGT